MPKLLVCGDTHGKIDLAKLRQKNFPEQKELTKEDILFQLGDFGWIWYPLESNKDQNYWLNWLATRNYTLVVIPGNHENYDEIFSLPIEEKWGGKVRVLESKERFGTGKIYFLERGEIYNFYGTKIWAFGGALSSDKDQRILGKDYWAQELPSWKEFEYGMSKLDENNWKVDFVLSHTMPVSIIEDIIHRTIYNEGKFKDPVAEYFEEVYKKLDFKEWHSGHFHSDIKLDFSDTNDGIFQCHYNKKPQIIKEI